MSARRYGGAHSPGAVPGTPVPTAGPGLARLRSALLLVAAMPLVASAIGSLAAGHVFAAVVDLAAYAAILGGVFLLGEGLKAERAFAARRIARPPALPRKLMGAVATGVGVFLAAWLGWGRDLFTAAGFAGLATASQIVAFGLDPMRAKGLADQGGAGARAAEALEKAEAHMAALAALAPRLGDRQVQERLGALMAQVRAMLAQVEADPRDLDRARRYLSVYLKGAHEATRKYADGRMRGDDPGLRGQYVALLADLEASFGRGRAMLLEDDRTDLEVEIEVLRERLQQEGA